MILQRKLRRSREAGGRRARSMPGTAERDDDSPPWPRRSRRLSSSARRRDSSHGAETMILPRKFLRSREADGGRARAMWGTGERLIVADVLFFFAPPAPRELSCLRPIEVREPRSALSRPPPQECPLIKPAALSPPAPISYHTPRREPSRR